MTDDLAAFLDAAEARAAAATEGPWELGDAWIFESGPYAAARSRSVVPVLVGMVRAVLALHKPVRVQTGTKTHGGPNEYGEACARCREPWPCADRAAALSAIPPTPTAEETR